MLSTHLTHPRDRRWRVGGALGLAAVLALSSCTGSSEETPSGAGSTSGGTAEAEPADVVTRAPDRPATLLASKDPAALAAATTAALFERSRGAVVADPTDATVIASAGEMAAKAGVPLLLAGGVATTEIDRLEVEDVAVVGPRAVSWAKGALKGSDVDVTDASTAQGAKGAVKTLDGLDAAERDGEVVVLTTGEPDQAAAAATAEAAGATVMEVPGGDVRAVPDVITALSGGSGGADGEPAAEGAEKPTVVALGDAFGPEGLLDTRVATAATGVLLPDGDQVVYPGERLVALYGTPGTPSLGVLGEQGMDASIARAQQVAATYDGIDDVKAMPAFEIITTVASSSAGADGDRSDEVDPATLVPWIEGARDAGVYVVLDLQPGTTDFLTQAKRYQDLLAYPNVGLALDPEWRLKPGQVHLKQIGSVGVDEINGVGTWLSEFVAERSLPQKVFLLHQFRTSMIVDRERLDTSRDELAYVIHADGNGSPSLKSESYAALTANAPDNVHWGWKNFYDEDTPTLTPQQTLQEDPVPEFVSYQ